MDIRAEKLAKARKKLRDHQEKKNVSGQKEENLDQSLRKCVYNEIPSKNFITDVVVVDQQVNESFTNTRNNEIIDMTCSEVKSDTITEMLISNKTNLEMQISDMSAKLTNLEYLYALEISNHNQCQQKNIALESEINNLTTKYTLFLQEATIKDQNINQLQTMNQILNDDKNNLSEQLELTKTMLTAKESENTQVNNQLRSYENQLDLLQLQIQQLTSDSTVNFNQGNKIPEETEALVEKISNLEHKIEILQKDKEQINSHYEHYIRELNEQLKLSATKNSDLTKDLENLYERENSLIEHISEMEVRLQSYKQSTDVRTLENIESEAKIMTHKKEQEELMIKLNELQNKYSECLVKIEELEKSKETESFDNNIYKHDNVNINKLNADIVSDKLAAQRATEQNEKLKLDIHELEQVIVKMGKDKLELTEKLTHEKQLSKGLALKLAELEETAKNIQNQLKAKDDEMIRLLNEYRDMEKKHELLLKDFNNIQTLDVDINQAITVENYNENSEHEKPLPFTSSPQANINVRFEEMCVKKEDAMVKLQERFLNIMDEVANLSDEKYRLEHIILQLQTETDTICEYVALYQQQRSLLKRREEERSNQLKIFQAECDKLKQHLEELNNLLMRFAADKELASFLIEESRHNDLARVKELLEILQNCSLINPKFKNLDLNIFYPCNCCSGQLIDI